MRNIRIEVRVSLPTGCLEPVAIEIAGGEFDTSPLPRDRELAFAFGSRVREHQLIAERERMSREMGYLLGEKLSAAIMEAFRSQDPVNGYDPVEWREMQEIARRAGEGG